MKYSHLLHSFARAALAARRILFPRQTTAAALAVALALGASLMMPGATAWAQDAAVASATQTVNINTADADALAARLKGVGPSKAQSIVRYRESYGPFASVEEITEVQGISKTTLDKNRAAITLE